MKAISKTASPEPSQRLSDVCVASRTGFIVRYWPGMFFVLLSFTSLQYQVYTVSELTGVCCCCCCCCWCIFIICLLYTACIEQLPRGLLCPAVAVCCLVCSTLLPDMETVAMRKNVNIEKEVLHLYVCACVCICVCACVLSTSFSATLSSCLVSRAVLCLLMLFLANRRGCIDPPGWYTAWYHLCGWYPWYDPNKMT